MNNALMELFNEYENNKEEPNNKQRGRKKKEAPQPVEPAKSELQRAREEKLLEKEEDIIKDKIKELIPEDIGDSSISDFLDDFDKELDLESIEEEIINVSEEIEKPKNKLKIKLKKKDEEPKVDTRELSFDEFMALAEKEYNEKETKRKAEEEAARLKELEQEQVIEISEDEDYEDILPEDIFSNINKSNIKDEKDEKSELSVEELMENSETYYKEMWLEYYEKAQRSKKHNNFQDKLRRGLFRFNKDKQIELLPEHETKGKTSLQLLREKWQ